MNDYTDNMSSLDQILAEAERLPTDQKLTLAYRLLASNEPEATLEVESAWDTEISERIRKFDDGTSVSRPAGKVFSELDRQLTS